MKKVFCIGELLIDFVAENQGSDLKKAFVFTKKAGGAPANVACAINKLGGYAAFIGAIGKDAFGDFLWNTLESHEVDLSLTQKKDTFTTLAFVSLDANGERDFVFSRGADKELQYDSSVKHLFNQQMVHFGAATSFLGGALEEAYGHYLFDALTQQAFISFDPNFRTDLWKKNPETFIKKCLPFIEKSHLCKFSLQEALLLSGKSHLEAACKELHEFGAPIICVTMGAEGTLVSTPKSKKQIPSTPVKVVDTTGAGDAFIGSLLSQISKLSIPLDRLDQELEVLYAMVSKANRAGALTTTKYGAIAAIPDKEILENN
jgi:fructokinase